MIAAAAIVAAGLLGGVYGAFSMIVMPALGRLGGREATAAMIRINRAAERGPFIGLFVLAAATAIWLLVDAAPRGSWRDLVVAALSLGSTAVTVVVNVPLNRELDKSGDRFWPTYRRRWATSNTLRTVLATGAVIVGVTR